MSEARSLGLAAQMAFWLFFSLVPLAAVAGLVAARIADARGEAASAALASVPSAVRDEVTRQLAQIARWNGGAIGPAAAVVFVVLASSGLHAVFDALELQVSVTRPWWKKRLYALGSCVGLSVGVALILIVATGLRSLSRIAGVSLPIWLSSYETRAGVTAARIVVGLLVAYAFNASLYGIGTPRVAARRRAIAPGALLSVALQAIGGWGYGLYLRLMGTSNAYQAGLGVVGVTLMLLYLFAVAILAGAQLNDVVSRAWGSPRCHAA